MTWPWRSPEATRRGLSDRIRRRYAPDQVPRRMREVAYRRLLARLFASRPEGWIVKGGAALLLRLDPNRTSNDVDVAFAPTAAGPADVTEALRSDASLNLGDFFRFVVGDAVLDPDRPSERAWSLRVVAYLGDTEWTTFTVDIVPAGAARADILPTITALVGDDAVDAIPGLRVLAVPLMIADKTCAMFERHGHDRRHSSRPRDLADLAMIAQQVDAIDGDEMHAALRAEERRRQDTGSLTGPLPTTLALDAEQARDWQRRWSPATRAAPITFDDALHSAERLIGPALASHISGHRWNRGDQTWKPRTPA